MSGVLHVNGVVSDVSRARRVVIHHGLSTLLTAEFQECLQGPSKEAFNYSRNTHRTVPPRALFLVGNKQAFYGDLTFFCFQPNFITRVAQNYGYANTSDGDHQKGLISPWNSSINNHCPSHEDVTKEPL